MFWMLVNLMNLVRCVQLILVATNKRSFQTSLPFPDMPVKDLPVQCLQFDNVALIGRL